MRKHYSQNEAHRLQKRVNELQQALFRQRREWTQEYVGGREIDSFKYDDANHHAVQAVRTARKLEHAVVAVGDDSGTVRLFALPHYKDNQ